MGALFSDIKSLTQANRALQIETPLGEDVLFLRKFEAREAFSQLFSYDIELLSYRDDIQASEILGENVTVVVDAKGPSPRHFNGYIISFEYVGLHSRGLSGYKAEVVPWLWFLGKTSDCRVFQNQPVTKILESVFTDLGFMDYNFSHLCGKYPDLEYCVQYRETDLDFVNRLLEQEGIYYYFVQENGKHILTLADNASDYAYFENKVIKQNTGTSAGEYISDWRHLFRFFSGKWGQSDYNFEKPDYSLLTQSTTLVKSAKGSNYEYYDYPGYYKEAERGRALTNLRMELEENSHDTVVGKSNVQGLALGNKFIFHSEEYQQDHKKGFVVTGLYHRASDSSYLVSEGNRDESESGDAYRNEFRCIPEKVTFRPPLKTPKPSIDGVQTAVVVGKPGDEIYTDKYGRIKLQFHWDRYGSKNEVSSCWVRVATQWAGKKWGTIAIPRVGQEVVVTFLNGDPDQPLVIGSVYNNAHKPPFDLPGAKTQSGMKSNSSKGGSNYNEISIDDKAGAEAITIHAAKDFNYNVGNNMGGSTTGNASASVDGNSSDSVGGDRSLSVGGNQTLSVTGNRTADISGNETQTVGGNQDITIAGDETVSTTNKTHNISAKHTVNASDQIFSVGSSQEFSASSQKFSISGKQNFQAGTQEFNVSGKASISASEIELSATSKITLSVGGSVITIDAGKIEITLGGSSVKVDPTGVTVMGPIVKLN